MKRFLILLTIIFAPGFLLATTSTLYNIKASSIDGKPVAMNQYKGKVLIIVNTASQCGYTPQLKGLEAIYKKYKSKGLEVLAFPSNDFKQDPSSNTEIMSYAQKNFQVSFPFFEKNSVVGASQQPVYKYLTDKQPATVFKDVAWNFEKFIVGKNGEVLARFPSSTTPESEQMIEAIEKALDKK